MAPLPMHDRFHAHGKADALRAAPTSAHAAAERRQLAGLPATGRAGGALSVAAAGPAAARAAVQAAAAFRAAAGRCGAANALADPPRAAALACAAAGVRARARPRSASLRLTAPLTMPLCSLYA